MESSNEPSLDDQIEVDIQEPSANEEEDLDLTTKLKRFLTAHWRGVVIVLTPLIFSFIIFMHSPVTKSQWCAYCLLIMAVYWVSECIPLPVTAFLPIVIFPLTKVMDTENTCKCYMNDAILMYLGSIFLAYSIEQSGLHIRLALCTIRLIGYSHYRLLLAICIVTTFISMWITNTAATVMVVPIVFALLKVFEDQGLLKIYDTGSGGEKIASDLSTCYFCAVTFSATIGGVGTLVGTATNLTFKGLFMKAYPEAPEYLSFPLFSAFAFPYMVVMEIFTYLYLIIVYFGFLRKNSKEAQSTQLNAKAIEAAKQSVDRDYKKLGRLTFWEFMVVILFTTAIMLFFCRSPQIFTGWGDVIESTYNLEKKFCQLTAYQMTSKLVQQFAREIVTNIHPYLQTFAFIILVGCIMDSVKDSAAALLIAFAMLVLPSSWMICRHIREKTYERLPTTTVRSILDWKSMNATMPYSFMFLLGGGFALSTAAKPEYSDLNGEIGKILKGLQNLPNLGIIFILIVVTVFITNFASNVAVANVFAPIAMQMAKEIGFNPLWYNIAVGFSASYCFCLPVGTPGNLVVQSAASVPTGKMIKAGIGPTVSTIILTWLFICFYAPVIWPDLHSNHDWMT